MLAAIYLPSPQVSVQSHSINFQPFHHLQMVLLPLTFTWELAWFLHMRDVCKYLLAVLSCQLSSSVHIGMSLFEIITESYVRF